VGYNIETVTEIRSKVQRTFIDKRDTLGCESVMDMWSNKKNEFLLLLPTIYYKKRITNKSKQESDMMKFTKFQWGRLKYESVKIRKTKSWVWVLIEVLAGVLIGLMPYLVQ
jgi:hypothetical protein